MEISNQSNNYQMLNSYQKQVEPTPLPVVLPEPENSNNSNIYEASKGNAIGAKDGGVELTPQGELNLSNAQASKESEAQANTQAQNDAKREMGASYLAKQSKQSQAEIYIAVASEGSDSDASNTASVIESLRDVQKQNNAVAAYATYQENQNSSNISFF